VRLGGAPPGAPRAEERGGRIENGIAEVVSRVKRYSGVGERTAETLAEAFGKDLFRVLDEEPDRVREILPDHRAERVLDARRREREAGGE
jgi:uroporphyrinogen-III synthase